MSTRRLFSPKYCVGHWPLRNHALDKSGYGNGGTWSGTEAYADGPFGKSAGEFNGSNAEINTGSSVSITGAASRSMACWIKTSNTGRQGICGYGNEASSQGFSLSSGTYAAGKIEFLGYAQDLAGVTTVADGLWHHVAVTYDGTTITLYVDGEFDSSGAKTLNTASGVFRMGRQGWSDGGLPRRFTGNQLNARLYSVALTGQEIKKLYLAEK